MPVAGTALESSATEPGRTRVHPLGRLRRPWIDMTVSTRVPPGVRARRASISRPSQEVPMAKDPVCGMTIDQARAAGKSEYQGQTYYFCSKGCKDAFDRQPDAYVTRADTRPSPSA
jgi:Cu+-exporting ATPase